MDQQVADAEAQAADPHQLRMRRKFIATKALEYNSDIAEKQQWLKQKRAGRAPGHRGRPVPPRVGGEGGGRASSARSRWRSTTSKPSFRLSRAAARRETGGGRRARGGERRARQGTAARRSSPIAALRGGCAGAVAAAARARTASEPLASKQTALDWVARAGRTTCRPPGARGPSPCRRRFTAAMPSAMFAFSRARRRVASAAPQSASRRRRASAPVAAGERSRDRRRARSRRLASMTRTRLICASRAASPSAPTEVRSLLERRPRLISGSGADGGGHELEDDASTTSHVIDILCRRSRRTQMMAPRPPTLASSACSTRSRAAARRTEPIPKPRRHDGRAREDRAQRRGRTTRRWRRRRDELLPEKAMGGAGEDRLAEPAARDVLDGAARAPGPR